MRTSTFLRWSSVVVLSFCLMPAAVLGAFIDQSQPLADSQSEARNDFFLGQTFTPSIAFPLSEIQLDVYKSGDQGAYVEVYAASGGLPTGSPLASSVLITDLPSSAGSWTAFELVTPISLTPSVQYAFAVKGNSDNPVNVRYNNVGAGEDYTGGTYLYNSTGWASLATRDLKFQTGHVPEPAAMVGLLSMGSLALVYSRLRRRSAKRAR